jgi:uncharacterized protein YutE (UPF0331/DUF86 family)
MVDSGIDVLFHGRLLGDATPDPLQALDEIDHRCHEVMHLLQLVRDTVVSGPNDVDIEQVASAVRGAIALIATLQRPMEAIYAAFQSETPADA